MYDQSAAGPSTPPTTDASKPARISGTIPGALDPTQTERLCRHRGSRLSFASFNPYTASCLQAVPELDKLSLNQQFCRPKRVVIETTLAGECFWRFVPNARRDEGVEDEGTWPRVVEICGRLYECSQDQWDIYKLDPLYECCVKAYPNLTIISRAVEPKPKPVFNTFAGRKRVSLSASPTTTSPPLSPRKRVHVVSDSGTDEEEGEIEEMTIDDQPKPFWTRPTRVKQREDLRKQRMDRWEKTARRKDRLTTQDPGWSSPQDFKPDTPATDVNGKRNINSLFESIRSNGHVDDWTFSINEDIRNKPNYILSRQGKRTRTVSPASARRELEAKRLKREKKKYERREQQTNARKQEREAQFLREVREEVPVAPTDNYPDVEGSENKDSRQNGPKEDNTSLDPEAVRKAVIEESRRKLAELEADRPLWEAAAARRKQEELEEELRRAEQCAAAKAEKERRRSEAERKAQEEERKKRAEQERDRREQEQRRRRRQSWFYGKWSQQRALERYLDLSKAFDETKFCLDNPLTMDQVPWPVLHSPLTFSVEDVTWQAVEEFFEVFRPKMRLQDFKTLVEKSQRRFHPDRWRSRSLLVSVVDEMERECMEVAANTVAQALTPLWQQLRAGPGRS